VPGGGSQACDPNSQTSRPFSLLPVYLFIYLLFSLPNFSSKVDWQSFTRGMSQIWLQVSQQSKKVLWSPPGTHYYLNMAISLFSKYGDFFSLFFSQNTLCFYTG
jgi:hypothetical protein